MSLYAEFLSHLHTAWADDIDEIVGNRDIKRENF